MLATVETSKLCKGKCQQVLPLEAFGVQARGKLGRKSECKKCLSEKEAARRSTDPEAYRAYKRQWWAESPHTKDSDFRARKSETAKAWYAENKDRQAANMKRWVLENPDKFRAIQRRYLAKNPVHIRRAVYMARIEKDLTADQWVETLAYFNHACAYCLRTDRPLTMDHVVPVSKGGPHTQSNVIPACKPCNSTKGVKSLFAMLKVEQPLQTQIQT